MDHILQSVPILANATKSGRCLIHCGTENMKLSALTLLALCVFAVAAAAQETDAERSGWRGKVKYVDRYEVYFCCTPNARKRGPRLFDGTTTFNRKGGYAEWISINNTSDGPYYERRVFRYDRDGRKTGADVYKSDRNPPETYFELARDADGKARLKPERVENLVERITYTYDADGRLIEDVSRDKNENLIMRRVYAYDRDGEMIRATVTKAGGIIDNESITVLLDGGLRTETTGIRPGSDVYRSITIRDREGRVIRGEQFSLKPEADGKTSRYLLQNRSLNTYINGRQERLDWIFYTPDETPGSKTVIVWDERGEYKSREEYNAGPLPAGSRNEDLEPAWTLRERSLYRREYDKRGNVVRSETRQQCGPELPLELTTIDENVITYY